MAWGVGVPAAARGPVLLLTVLVAHALTLLASYTVLGGGRAEPVFWPSNGVLLAALVLGSRRLAPWAVAGAVASDLVVGLGFGVSPGWALAYATANLVEVVIAAALFVRWCPDLDLGSRRGFVSFTVAALAVGPAAGAALGATASSMDVGAPWAETFAYWWAGDAVGLLLVGATLIAFGPGTRGEGRRPRAGEWAAVLLLVAALSALPLVTGDRPLVYLPLPAMLWAAVRFGVRGALVSGLVLAGIREPLVARGIGAFAAQAGSQGAALAYLTLFVLIAVLTAWSLAVEVRHREAAERRAATERQARISAEALVERLARMRSLTEALSRATTRDDVLATWRARAAAVLGGRGHRLLLADADRELPAGDGEPGSRPGALPIERRAVAARRVIVEIRPGAGDAGAGQAGSAVAAPIVADGEVLGALSCVHPDGDAADPVPREAAAAVAARLADALVRVRLFARTVETGRRLELLQDLTSRLGRAPTTDSVVATVLHPARQALGASAAGLLVGDASGRLHVRGSWGEAPAELRIPAGPLDPDDSGPVAASVAGMVPVDGPMQHPSVAPAADPRRPVDAAPSWVVLPMALGSGARAVVWFAWDAGAAAGREDRQLHESVAEQCAAALRRVMATDVEHEAAVKLQQALLPRGFPAVAGLVAAARYVPSSEALSVGGGDWYDVVARPDGRGVVMVGDVVGHDVAAAAAMGQLCSALATTAGEAEDPAAALDQLDAFPGGRSIGFATAVYAEYDPARGILRYACAGHPPPLLVKPWGEAEFLVGGRSTPLFAVPAPRRTSSEARIEAGSLLVCYTDGLVERIDRTLYEGLLALARACLAHRREPLAGFTDRVLTELTGGRALADDVALLCVALDPTADRLRASPAPGSASAAAAARRGPRPIRA